jgi:transposase-like protein
MTKKIQNRYTEDFKQSIVNLHTKDKRSIKSLSEEF